MLGLYTCNHLGIVSRSTGPGYRVKVMHTPQLIILLKVPGLPFLWLSILIESPGVSLLHLKSATSSGLC